MSGANTSVSLLWLSNPTTNPASMYGLASHKRKTELKQIQDLGRLPSAPTPSAASRRSAPRPPPSLAGSHYLPLSPAISRHLPSSRAFSHYLSLFRAISSPGQTDGGASILNNFERKYNDFHRFPQNTSIIDSVLAVLKSPDSASTNFYTLNEKNEFFRPARFARGNGIFDAARDLENSRRGTRMT